MTAGPGFGGLLVAVVSVGAGCGAVAITDRDAGQRDAGVAEDAAWMEAGSDGGLAVDSATLPPLGTDDAGDVASAWTPAVLAGVVLWLDAGKGTVVISGQKVTLWMDQSLEGNHVFQNNVGSMPSLTPDEIRGLPALTFDGVLTALAVPDTVSTQWGVGDYSVLVVARCMNGSTDYNLMLYQKTQPAWPWEGVNLLLNPATGATTSGQLAVVDDANHYIVSGPGGFNDGVFRLYGGRRQGSVIETRVNGAPVGRMNESPATLNVDAVGSLAYIGSNGRSSEPGFQSLKGDIAELVAVKGAIADVDLARLEAYLMSKYGLSQ